MSIFTTFDKIASIEEKKKEKKIKLMFARQITEVRHFLFHLPPTAVAPFFLDIFGMHLIIEYN